MNGTQSVVQWMADAGIREKERNEFLELIDNKYGKKTKVKDVDEKLTLKQQILLLEALGILNMKEIKSLPVSKQAIVLSNLLNRGEKSVKDHLTYLNKKEPHPEFFCRKDDNVAKVKEVLKSIGISEANKK